MVALCGYMRNAACVNEDTTPQDPFEPEVDIRVYDGNDTPLALTVDMEGKPTLLTTLNPIVAADILINVASGILTGAVVPDNFPRGEALREMLIEVCHKNGFSDEATDEILAWGASDEFDPAGLNDFLHEAKHRDDARKNA